jgi:queuine tRNA-ribosyltransferase
MFDCVLPTRNARHGVMYRFRHDDFSKDDFYEVVHITNEKWQRSNEKLVELTADSTPIDQELSRYTYGYVCHLFRIEEMLGQRLATLVNLRFYLELMKRIRTQIEEGRF